MVAVLTVGLSFSVAAAQRLHLVGDSTMSDKVNPAYPERGWGQLLPGFLSPEVEVINRAANGRSTRRFVNEGRWQALLDDLQAGDYVLIQFGHNDQKKSDPERYASVDKDYPAFLRQFIRQVQEKDATPMLASSICRRHFDENGELKLNLADYAQAARMVAKEEQVTFFDLQKLSCDFIQQQGPVNSQPYFIQVPADLYQKFPEGKTDNTHLTLQGASRIAQLFVRELKRQQHPLAAQVVRERL
ncbi:GntR family transcriptional regulator [Lacimicrobium alkaliphilum]|uniref:GntR family transcriptional regulator n=1 Tax=Lacimicrobium alkaliphilum TaxID=1526571 RepID=A0A0U2ZBI3_9ALTE|nr:GntR family transcriptional regulator [Lacimicrobium alkaliphilum]